MSIRFNLITALKDGARKIKPSKFGNVKFLNKIKTVSKKMYIFFISKNKFFMLLN